MWAKGEPPDLGSGHQASSILAIPTSYIGVWTKGWSPVSGTGYRVSSILTTPTRWVESVTVALLSPKQQAGVRLPLGLPSCRSTLMGDSDPRKIGISVRFRSAAPFLKREIMDFREYAITQLRASLEKEADAPGSSEMHLWAAKTALLVGYVPSPEDVQEFIRIYGDEKYEVSC